MMMPLKMTLNKTHTVSNKSHCFDTAKVPQRCENNNDYYLLIICLISLWTRAELTNVLQINVKWLAHLAKAVTGARIFGLHLDFHDKFIASESKTVQFNSIISQFRRMKHVNRFDDRILLATFSNAIAHENDYDNIKIITTSFTSHSQRSAHSKYALTESRACRHHSFNTQFGGVNELFIICKSFVMLSIAENVILCQWHSNGWKLPQTELITNYIQLW